MRGVNKVILVGNLGQDPDVRTSQSGATVATCSLATSSVWTDANGQKQEKVEWHRLVMFNRLAEIAGQYLRKGAPVYIEGSLQTRKWEKEGVTMHTTEVSVREMQMLGRREDSGGGSSGYDRQKSQQEGSFSQQQPASQPSNNNQSGSNQGAHFDDFDDDIPF